MDLVEERTEHQANAENAQQRQVMLVDQAGEQNGQRLSQGHDGGEDERSELGDRVEHEQLTGGRADREQEGARQAIASY